MKILFATEYWPPFAPGGAEWTNEAWARALARRGHRVVVVTPNYGAAAREDSHGVTIVRVPIAGRLEPGREARWLAHRNPLFHARFARWLGRVARTEGAQLVHAQNKGAVVAARRAARTLGLPFVVTIRDVGLLCPVGACPLFDRRATYDCSTRDYVERCVPFFLEHYAAGDGTLARARRRLALRLAWLDQRALRRALAEADLVLGVSRGILSIFPPALVSRARVVHSPLPDVAVTPDDADSVRPRLGLGAGPLVLYAGKRSLGKGTDVLVRALDTIRASVPGVSFVFAGKGELAPPDREDVRLLGSVPQPMLFALYRAADVVVVPSVWPEPLSRVLIEAMHFGRAVVATSVGGNPELVEEDVTGLLVEPGDAEALARAVVALLRDPGRRARLGAAAARRTATELDEERLAKELLAAYESVL
jgi:glycosyltransferase involved in cell wall biosynthesis